MNRFIPTEDQKHKLYKEINEAAIKSGYYLNPDIDYDLILMNGLLVNENRYGYISCPCRLASGNKRDDLDIICPCDYRDADLEEFGMCYCSLYVSKAVIDGEIETKSIPERRESIDNEDEKESITKSENINKSAYPVWRCKVCGYLCARDNPPGVCPICKAQQDRFESFNF